MNIEQVISRCKKNERRAQNILFNHYAPVLKSICIRYMKNEVDAEDALIKGFYKIFKNLNSYKGIGSFEGWMKRIVINESLMLLRKNHNINMMVTIDDISATNSLKVDFVDNLTYEDILVVLDKLPVGYRTIFNLYVIEGYKHREIAEQLGISINTSKSQLILAKKKMRMLLKKKLNIKSA
ncbi:MAG: sigma-70 family RNA polymerase sigma factor [Saprospiraceae bacterium]